ncbi:hypothetical protein EWM62_14025 [Mucilaginibacter terrigena]|uniref:Tail specific protease domain-containing protein n=1 Tax=Mucilaginibacter terrigena TaxID=2492395 RepID=A0A4Q5LJ83_9SPHI|nr:S41 family peptidase [Mucilaginibacter terrigena]RYU89438.1 hypothetical protein EWM62_14025 [Mucilaginibacter terrigena]
MKHILIKSFLLSALTISVFAQQPGAALTQQQKNETIDSAVKIVKTRYIFPEAALKVEKYLRNRQAKKMYDPITDGNQFAQALTHDMQAAGNDKHLWAAYSPEELPIEKTRELMSIPDEERSGLAEMFQRTNYGIEKLEILKGNIGYLSFNMLISPEFAGEVYDSMMAYVAHTEALIIDLRKCGGSMSPDAVPYFCSYFFQSPVHLNDTYYGKDAKLTQSWTYAHVNGRKYLNKPIYVLTSGGTFSGAEEMAYDLKALKRATIIGQPTGGGANPGGVLRLTSHFSMFVPVGKVVNPVTKGNWEHVGVQPDTVINAKLALQKAQELAMLSSIKATNDDRWKGALIGWMAELAASTPKLKAVTFELRGFDTAKEVYVAGSFNDWDSRAAKMERKKDKWVVVAEAEPGKVTYKFIVDGKWIPDPANTQTEEPNGDSVIVIE